MKKLFVGNIDWAATDEDLAQLFAKYGEIEEAIIVKDKYSNRSKGFGFVTYKEDGSAEEAMRELDGYELNGRKIAVNEARPSRRDERN